MSASVGSVTRQILKFSTPELFTSASPIRETSSRFADTAACAERKAKFVRDRPSGIELSVARLDDFAVPRRRHRLRATRVGVSSP